MDTFPLLQLPSDILRYVISILNYDDLKAVCITNRLINKKICNTLFWITKICNEFLLFPEEIKVYKNDNSYAAYYFYLKIIQDQTVYLLSRGICWNKIDLVKIGVRRGESVHRNGEWALLEAAYAGQTEIVKFLTENGADIHFNDDEALTNAAYQGHTETVKFLLDNGSNIHCKEDYCIRIASENGHTETVKILLENGSNLHALEDEAMLMACYHNRPEILKLLIEYGADIRVENNAAFKHAFEKRHVEIIKILLDAGVGTPASLIDFLTRAIRTCGYTEIAKLIGLKMGISLTGH